MIKKDFKIKLIVKQRKTKFTPATIGLSALHLDHIEGASLDQLE